MKKQTVAFSVMPAVPWGTEERCITLEAGFARQLLGLCGVLTLYRMWDGTNEEIAIVQAQVEKGIAALMGCGCSDDAIVSLKQSKGGYLVATNGDGSTTQISSVYTAESYNFMPETQPTTNGSNQVCSGARMLVTRLLEDILFSLDQAQLTADTGQAIAQGISALVDLVTLGAFPLEDVYDGAQEFFFASAELGITTLKVVFGDPDVREQWIENLYCAIVENSPKMLTEDIYLNSIAGLPLGESQSTLLAFFLRGFSTLGEPNWDRIFRLYNLGALSEDPTCAAEYPCSPPWILECDLTLTDGGLDNITTNGGVWTSGVGWQATTWAQGATRHRNIAIGAEYPEAIYTGAGMTFTYEAGFAVTAPGSIWVLQAGGHPFSADITINDTPPESPWDVEGGEFEGTNAAFAIPVGIRGGGVDPGGNATMTAVRLYGVGFVPTIEGFTQIA